MCQKGRWAQSITLGQAADIVVGSLPGSVQNVQPMSFTTSQVMRFEMQVITRAGKPAAGAEMRLRAPGLIFWGNDLSARADANGVVVFRTTMPAPRAGNFEVQIFGDPVPDPIATFTATVSATASTMTVVSGNQRLYRIGEPMEPFVVQVSDRAGQPVLGATIETLVSTFDGPATVTEIGGGQYRFVFATPQSTGVKTAHVVIRERYGANTIVRAKTELTTTILAEAPSKAYFSNANQQAFVGEDFALPLQIVVLDEFGHLFAPSNIRLEALVGPTGATGEIVSTTDGHPDGFRAWLRANSVPGLWTIRVTIPGLGIEYVQFQNL